MEGKYLQHMMVIGNETSIRKRDSQGIEKNNIN